MTDTSLTSRLVELIFGQPEALRNSATPLYIQLQSLIQEAISQGILQCNDALPAEREIASTMKVSRVTVKRAIDDLVNDGILTQRQGAGTFVNERVVHELNRLNSFSEVILAVDKHPDSRWIERGVGLATSDEIQKLRLQPGDEVVRMFRVRMADDKPVALEHATVPRKFLDNPFGITGSLYEALDEAGIRPVKAIQRLRAVAVDATYADYLDIPVGSPVIFLERHGLLEDDTPVEHTRSHFLGDTFDFVTVIREP
ncbi:GntR family transcriptional regulator [Kistimonas scapharcae]|uniref:GntR family transcriptional regulator n=1 Tax=Kistimonas scapharcae TaxID=1036133 RepID=A0ABP8V1T5_9GAMM